MITETELCQPIEYQPVFNNEDLVDAIAALTKRVETLEKSSNESLRNDLEELRKYIYKWQLKQQRIEAYLKM